jgi:hypothetical protein
MTMNAAQRAIEMAARSCAENEARFPELRGIRTHPALDIIPMATDDEFARLVWSIRKIGQIRPILVDESDRIIDGRARYAACQIAGVEPKLAPPKDGAAGRAERWDANDEAYDD